MKNREKCYVGFSEYIYKDVYTNTFMPCARTHIHAHIFKWNRTTLTISFQLLQIRSTTLGSQLTWYKDSLASTSHDQLNSVDSQSYYSFKLLTYPPHAYATCHEVQWTLYAFLELIQSSRNRYFNLNIHSIPVT